HPPRSPPFPCTTLFRSDVAQRLTREQAAILQVTRLIPRVEVRGGAGSGKTVLALEQARQLTRGRHDLKAQRVALICYSLGLAEQDRKSTRLNSSHVKVS